MSTVIIYCCSLAEHWKPHCVFLSTATGLSLLCWVNKMRANLHIPPPPLLSKNFKTANSGKKWFLRREPQVPLLGRLPQDRKGCLCPPHSSLMPTKAIYISITKWCFRLPDQMLCESQPLERSLSAAPWVSSVCAYRRHNRVLVEVRQ